MRTSKLTTLSLIALLSLTSGPALATHEGTWHGGDRAATTSFCVALGNFAGDGMKSFCSALLG